MSKNQEYASLYADAAMQQMKRYGIPASVILAQGILESSNGQSELSRTCNNHFGIKATSAWLKNGGEYALFTDDRPNEKFCKYATVADSYEHHSQFLKNNSRYAKCFTLSPDDYKGWTKGIERAGYATGGNYAANLQRIIEANNLQQYDQQVMDELREQREESQTCLNFPESRTKKTEGQMRAEGRSFGTEANPREQTTEQTKGNEVKPETGEYSFPVKRDEFLFITSPFGMRQDPMDASKQQMHKGIDIRCNHDDVLATENNGKVVAVNHNANTTGGKSVTVEYNRQDGSKVQCTYMHLSEIAVKVGDTVSAKQKLGVSGNTGTRTTGEHLHFGVKTIAADGSKRDIDPAAYLAEIAQKGNIRLQALSNGTDLLVKYKTETPSASVTEKLSPDAWMKKLLSSEDAGTGLSATNDPILDMAMTAFSSLMLLAVQIDNKNEEEQKSAISEAVSRKSVNLTSLVQGMKSCNVIIAENGKTVLQADNGSIQISRELSSKELNRLSATLNDTSLSEETKRMRVAGLVSNIVLSEQASRNFEQGMSEQQGRVETIKR